MTNHLSAGEHVGGVISRCAQSLHAVKLLRHHSMNDRLGETRLQGRRPLQAVSSFIYLFKHRRQRAEATYMPVKSIQ